MNPLPLRTFPAVLALLCALIPACATTSQSQDTEKSASEPVPDPASSKVAIEGREIAEASGMATSAKHPGISWIINDGKSGNLLFAVAADGTIRAQIPVDGIRTRDAEDLAAFPWRGVPHLLIADVGDNASTAASYTLHAVPEPDLGSKSARPSFSIRFRYEDGPHNCESVAVDPARAEILLVTKGKSPTLFTLPLLPTAGDEVASAKRAGAVAAPAPEGLSVAADLRRIATGGAATGLDLSPDRRTAALLTYSHVSLYRRAGAESWAEAFSRPPAILPMPELLQAEALTFSRDARQIRIASERLPAQIATVTLPK